MKRIGFSLALIGILLIPLTGCMERQGRPVLSPAGDTDIVSRFKIELNKHSEINIHNLDIDSHDGIFTLSGIVDTTEDKRALARMARRLRGVREIIDNLIVRPKEP